VNEPPAEGLLTQWGFIPSPPPKARGRNTQSASTDANSSKPAMDPLTAIVTMVTPLITTLLTRQINAISDVPSVSSTPDRALKRSLDTLDPTLPSGSLSSDPPPASRRALSSPPPDVEHELEACMVSFGRSRALADGIINTAIENLAVLGYTPEVLADTDISNSRIGEVSKLPEGTVSALRKFARQWCGRVDAKRARVANPDA